MTWSGDAQGQLIAGGNGQRLVKPAVKEKKHSSGQVGQRAEDVRAVVGTVPEGKRLFPRRLQDDRPGHFQYIPGYWYPPGTYRPYLLNHSS
jgi:hypothetical protein